VNAIMKSRGLLVVCVALILLPSGCRDAGRGTTVPLSEAAISPSNAGEVVQLALVGKGIVTDVDSSVSSNSKHSPRSCSSRQMLKSQVWPSRRTAKC